MSIEPIVPQISVVSFMSCLKQSRPLSTWLMVFIAVWVLGVPTTMPAQENTFDAVDLSEVKDLIASQSIDSEYVTLQMPWWQTSVGQMIEPGAERIEATVNDLLCLAIANSAKISIARHVPLIRQTSITEAAASFDWTRYVESSWNDTSDPVGSDLTVGAGASRFRDEKWDFTAGSRRRLFGGGNVDLSQELGHQENNSTFFVPEDQATSRIVLGYTQPLLRGRGRYYNTSLILLAKIDVQSSKDEFARQLQAHLLEVARSYWSLYLERARLAQQIRLYKKTRAINDVVETRQEIDAQRTQLISTRAALETRRSDLIRAVAAVKNAETRLKALINAPELNSDNPDQLEIVPIEHPSVEAIPADLGVEFATAVSNRPELDAAMRSIRAACVRLKMARHEILPRLDLVTQTYLAGLRGNSEFGNAWLDQFRRGEPSYSVGLQYEIPVGRRAAHANRCRRELELSQMREEYRNAMELIRSEVEVAVREVETAFRELLAKDRARSSAELEAETLEARWRQLPDDVAAGLTLESLLRAQERVNQVEFEFARAQLTYNLALVNLRHANGTLIDIAHGNTDLIANNSRAIPVQSDSADIKVAPIVVENAHPGFVDQSMPRADLEQPLQEKEVEPTAAGQGSSSRRNSITVSQTGARTDNYRFISGSMLSEDH